MDAAATPGARLLELVQVMDRLRTQCPWDREQTHETLARYLLEEAYETLEAIDSHDSEHLREELGDLLLQVVFHARIASEDPQAPWDIDDVAGGVVDKLVRRHPHVFSGLVVTGVDEVEANWQHIKAGEKRRESVLAGVPATLPALARAEKLLSRAHRAGLVEPRQPVAHRSAQQIGDALFELVREATASGVDPEQALRGATQRFVEAVQAGRPQG